MILSHKLISLLLLLIFLTQTTLNVCGRNSNSTNILCFETERKALLSFKQDLQDPEGILSSWVAEEKNCCEWYGIVCDNSTGHVQELRLAADHDFYLGNYSGLQGKINPSLLDLKQLSHLDLSHNDFEGTQIPSFIGSLVSLRYLNLTGAGFEGVIPHQLGNLSSLRHLGLGDGYRYVSYSDNLYVENLHWLSSLSSLEYLDMSVNLSKASDHWLHAINKLPSLLELHLSYTNFTSISILDISGNNFNSFIPDWVFSLSSLVELYLSYSQFIGSFPNGSFSLTSLTSLDVSGNSLGCTFMEIPSYFYGFSNLEYLNLGQNKLQGVVSDSIRNLTSLVYLDLSSNKLNGSLLKSVGSLSNLQGLDISNNLFSLSSLVKLDLSQSQFIGSFPNGSFSLTTLTDLDVFYNSLSCTIPNYFYGFSNLELLYLGQNKLQGVVSNSIGNLTYLSDLDLSNNKLNGSLPESLGSLSNLQFIDISNNLFEGVVSEVHFANLTNLSSLTASENSLSLRVNPGWIPPFHLYELDLRSWNLGSSQFPTWLKSQKGIRAIDLSNTGISEAIPRWFSNLSTNFEFINLCENQISGEIPSIPSNYTFLTILLSSNKFKGPIPSMSFRAFRLNLSNNSLSGDISESLCHPTGDSRLSILRLGRNLLSGKIPDCWMYYPSLRVIDLSSNNLTGPIPNSMESLHQLRSFRLRNNSLSGEIPSSLRNCTELGILDLGLNKFVGSIPNWVGISLPNLMILIIRSNKFNDHIPMELCRITGLQIFDAANNNLSGNIPRCFNNFSQMATKNKLGPESISYVSLYFEGESYYSSVESAILVTKGREDKYDKFLGLVTILNLSNNSLSEEIPKQFTSLLGLWSLNLSGNHLRGSISNQIGNMTWLETLDLSRNKLSGNIPTSISSLTFLNHLNLSYNNLSGEIPLGTQLQTSDNSSFIGNQLCGPPLTKSCHGKNNTTHKGTEHGEGLNDEEEYWFRSGIAMGFVVGFLGIIAPLLVCRIWRHAYYWFWQDYMMFKIVGWFINFKNMLRI